MVGPLLVVPDETAYYRRCIAPFCLRFDPSLQEPRPAHLRWRVVNLNDDILYADKFILGDFCIVYLFAVPKEVKARQTMIAELQYR